MKSSHIKGLLIASGVAVIALAGTIGGTFALFNRNLDVVTHVKIGNLNFSFVRSKFTEKALNERGYLEDKTDNTEIDLSENGAKAFDLSDVAPGSEAEAFFKLTNIGGTAFETSLSLVNIEVKENDQVSSDVSWLENVSVTCNEGEDTIASFALSEPEAIAIGDLEKGGTSSFSLKFIFDKESIGNEAQNKEISFGIRLSCTQLTAER